MQPLPLIAIAVQGGCRHDRGVLESASDDEVAASETHSLSSPEWRGLVADIERAATPRGRSALGFYVIEGVRLHERALRAGVRVDRAVVTDALRRSGGDRIRRLLDDLTAAGCRLQTAPDEVVAGLTDGRKTGGLLGLVRLPSAPDLASIVGGVGQRAVLLVAADVEDPGNVGALTRTALAGFATAFVAVGISDPYHPRALRTSMGSVFKLPILSRPTLPPLLEELRALSCATVGAVAEGATSLADADLDEPRLALLMGSEAFGIDAEAAAGLDQRVTIPMAPGVDSFSVNAAAAILLHEIYRRSGADR